MARSAYVGAWTRHPYGRSPSLTSRHRSIGLAWRPAPGSTGRSERHLAGLLALHDRDADRVAPLGPRAVVVADRRQPQQVRQHEPRVARALADAAVGDDLVVRRQPLLAEVDRLELVAGLEAPVLRGRARPRHALRTGDVTAAQGTLIRVLGHVRALAGVLGGRADVDELTAEEREDVVLERADRGVVPLDDRVVAALGRGDV